MAQVDIRGVRKSFGELEVVHGAGHDGSAFTSAEQLERIDNFLRRHLSR